MSSKNTQVNQSQSPEELSEGALKSISGGNQDLTDPNPPAEVPSPSKRTLDPSSAMQSPNY